MTRIPAEKPRGWLRIRAAAGVALSLLLAAAWWGWRGAPVPEAPRPRPPGAVFIAGLDDASRFVLRDGSVSAFVGERGVALALPVAERVWGLHWSVPGARTVAPVPDGEALPGKVHDLRHGRGGQRAGLSTYERLAYRGLFEGVDLVLEPRSRGLEYTLLVGAGAPLPELRFRLEGAEAVTVQDSGEAIEIATGAGRLREGRLHAYQDGRDGVRRDVPVRYAYARREEGALAWEYGLEVGEYDRTLPLVIDPTLSWSTYLGASTGDLLYGMAVDTSGNRYLTGRTVSPDFPIVGGFQNVMLGANDVFVTKIGPGDTIVWSTFFGGTGAEVGFDIAVDAASAVYVVGETDSPDLPIVGGFQPVFGGTANRTDAFILKVAPAGSAITWSSYLGGTHADSAQGLAVDASGNVFVTGFTQSVDFPVLNAIQPGYGGGGGSPTDAFVTRINAAGSSLAWSTYLGGGSNDSASDVALDATGLYLAGFTASPTFPVTAGAFDTTLAGQDAFVTKVSLAGTGLLWSTFLGGAGTDTGVSLAVDGSGSVFVAGNTGSADFPFLGGFDNTLGGAQDQFVTRLNATGSGLGWSTFLGGSASDTTYSMKLDAASQVFVCGETASADYPILSPFDSTWAGMLEGTAARINAGGGSLGWSSFLGGSQQEHIYALGWDGAGNLNLAGYTNSTDFPILGGFDSTFGGAQDGFVTRVSGAGVVVPSGGTPTKLAFITAPQTVPAGACSAVATVQSQDASSLPANVTANTTVNLSAAPAAGFLFYSDAACSAAITLVTIPTGQNSANLYFKGATPASVVVTAQATGLTSGTQTETITAGAPTQLVYTTAPQTLAAGSCSTIATVERRDASGNPVTAGTTTVNLAAAPAAGFTFYSDPGCATAVTAITIGAGVSTGNFYFRGTAAGSVTATASATGLSPASQVETILAGTGSVLAFTTPPQTLVAGDCSAIVNVQRRDGFGNPVTSGATTVSLTANPPTGVVFYTDAGCSNPVISVPIGAGSSVAAFYFRGNSAQTVTVTASAAGFTPASQVETLVPGPAARLIFTTLEQTVAAGSCSAVTTVQRVDSWTNPVSTGVTTVNLAAAPSTGFVFYSDPGCAIAVTSVTIGDGTSTANLYFRGTVAGSVTVTASATGLTPASQVETITAGAAAVLAFTTFAQTVPAGGCSAIATVERRDGAGNPVTGGTTTVNLAAAPVAGFTFYSDPACGTAVTSVTIGAGSSTGSFYFRGTAAGSVTVTASATGLTSATQVETITAGAATALVFTTAPQTLAAGSCSAIASVQRRDGFGNPVTSGSTTVNLGAAPAAGFTFYSDPACATPAVSITIGAGVSTGSFYFRGTAVGSVTVTASATGLTPSTQVETITAGAAAALAFTTAPQTVAAGSCSAIASVQRRDGFGNPVTAGTTTVNLAAAPATGFTFYSDPACATAVTSVAIGAGASTGSFYFRGTVAGSVTVTASATGLTSATQVETITAGAATALAFTTAPQTLAAGSCSAVTSVQRRDASGNPVTAGATTVNLAAAPAAGFTFYSDPGCTTAAVSITIGAGVSTGSFYFRGTAAGSVTVTASATGLTSATQVETITAGAAAALAFTTAPQTVTAAACSAIATVQRRDAFANPVTAGTTTVNLGAAPAGGFTFYSDPACATPATSVSIGAGASTASFYFRGTVAGSVTVTASATGLTSATQVETITAGAAVALAFTTAPQTRAAGSCSGIATVERRDGSGNPVTAGTTTVNLAAAPAAGFTFYADPACGTPATSVSIGAGSSTGSFYFRGTAAGSVTVTASATGLTSATQVETITAAAATALAFTTAPQTLAAGSCSSIASVQRRDGFGNPVTAGTTTVNLAAAPATGFTFYSDPACATAVTSVSIGAGASTGSFYFRGTAAGSVTVTASATGLTSATQVETITAGAAAALAFTTAPQTVAASTCSAVTTVERRDSFGNPVTAGTTTVNLAAAPATGFTFYSDPGCTTAVTSVAIGAGASTGSFYFRGTAAGSVTVTASATGLTSATQVETITAGAPTVLAFLTAPQTVTAGSCSGLATVERRDGSGNPVTTGTTTVNLAAAPAAGFAFYADPACGTAVTSVTIGAGSSTASFYFRGTAAGSVTVTASATGFTSATQVETITAGAATALAFTTAPQTVGASGCSAIATVQRRDAFANPVTAGTTTVNLGAAPAGGFTFYSDPACATPAVSVSIGAGASTASFYFRGTVAGAVTVTASATGLTSATQVETITAGAAVALAFTTAPQTVAAGSCSGIATVQRRDGSGNPVTAGITTVNLAAAPAAGFTFYADPACATPATSVSIGAGASTGSFYFRGTAAGSVTVTASATGLTSATQVETITAAAATALAFTTAPQTLAAGSCSSIASVQRRDGFGNPVTAGTTTVNLAAAPATGFTFYSDPACATAVTSVSIGAGASTGSFYFRGTAAGSVTVTASATGLTSATQVETITAAGAAALAFTTAPQTVAASTCSAVATVERRDSFGNPVTAGTTTVNLAAAPATGFTFYSDPACATVVTSLTIGAGASTGGFYFRGSAAGSVTVTASATGLTSATQVETITAGAPTVLAFLTAPQTVTAGSCSGLATVERRDGAGNPVTTGTTTVNLAAAPAAGFAFYADPACGTAVTSVTIGAGSSTGSFYFRGTAAGSVTATASATGFTQATQVETITAGAATALAFTTAPQTVGASGCSAIATVQRRDAFANPVTAGTTTVNLAAAPATGFTFYSDPGCVTAVTSVAIGAGASAGSFYFRGTAAGSVTVTASATGLTSATQVETIVAGAATALAFTTAPQTRAAGSCSAAATVQRRDGSGNPVTTGTTTVNLAAAPATGFTLYADPGCTTPVATITIVPGSPTESFYFRGTVAGAVTVTASATGLTSATQVETITAAGAAALAFTTAPQTRAASVCSAVATVERRDSFGNPVTAGSTTVNLAAAPATGFAFYSDPGCATAVTAVTIGAGASSGGFYFAGTAAGAVTVTASATGLTSATQVETITAAGASALAFTTAPQTVAAGSCSAVATVERRDGFGNPVTAGATTVNLAAAPATGFTFYADPACATPAASVAIGAGASTGGFYFRGTAAGTVTVTASATGLSPATQAETITAAAASVLAFITPPRTLPHGQCSAVVTVESRDGSGNPSPVAANTPLTLGSPSGTMSFYADPGCAAPLASPAIPAAASTLSLYFRDTGVGAKVMTASATGYTGASQTHTLTNSDPVANAGLDQTVGEVQAVTLDGSASSDADADPLTWSWSQTGGPAVTLSSTTAARPTFTSPVVFQTTTLVFQLVANDGFTASAPDVVQITVNNTVNEAPVANAGPDRAVQAPASFTLDGTGSSDPNGTPLTYQWTQLAGPPVTIADPATATQTLTSPLVIASTTLTFQLVVNDGVASSAADLVDVVVAPGASPQITSVPRRLTATGVDYQYDSDSTVDAVGAGTISFSLVSGPAGFTVSAAGVVSYRPAQDGSFPVTIRAQNMTGLVEQSFVLKVVSAPEITSTPQGVATAYAPYRYDADGLPTAVGTPTIGWTLQAGPAGAVVAHDTGEVLWTPVTAGPAAFVLRASNAFGFADQPFTVQVGSTTRPAIQATANASAQRLQRYVYDADGKVDVQPAGAPVRVVSGPPGFRVDPLTAEVSWVPQATGTFQVELVAGVAPVLSDPYRFQVTVVDVAPAPPTAVAAARPASGTAPLDVTLDGLGSSASGGRALLSYRWDPGDGSHPRSEPLVSHRYALPGGYTPALTVMDDLGARATASTPVQVGSGGLLPPAAQLFVDRLTPGAGGSAEVALRCQCTDPQGQALSYAWRFGDGTTSSQAAPTHLYLRPGSYRVELTVSNSALSTRASTEVVVMLGELRPPEARAFATPVSGPAPLGVRLTSVARDTDGYIASRRWSFPDGTSADLPELDRVFSQPGLYEVTFSATDDDGLSSTDRVVVTVLSAAGVRPPAFASMGARQVVAGTAYRYDEDGIPLVEGDAPITFELGVVEQGTLVGAPQGAAINAQTGEVTWTPAQSGVERLILTATNPAGVARQELLVQVEPGAAPRSCGCGQSGGGAFGVLGLGLALALWARGRRRAA